MVVASSPYATGSSAEPATLLPSIILSGSRFDYSKIGPFARGWEQSLSHQTYAFGHSTYSWESWQVSALGCRIEVCMLVGLYSQTRQSRCTSSICDDLGTSVCSRDTVVACLQWALSHTAPCILGVRLLAVNHVIWMQVLGASVEMVMSIPTS